MNFLRTTLLANCCFIAVSGFSQSQEPDEIVDVTNVTKFTLLDPGFSYEARIGKNQTIYGQVFMNTSFTYSDYFGTDYSIYFDPALAFQYRYYYNGKRRQQKELRTEMNSLNYIAPVYEVIFSRAALTSDYYTEDNRRAINRLGVVWGFQRNYKDRFSLDVNLGLACKFGKSTALDYMGNPVSLSETAADVVGLRQINLGIWLNKRKKNIEH